MNMHDFPRTPLDLMIISGNAQLNGKINRKRNVLFMCILHIYIFLFYIFSFFKKHPFKNLGIKVCNRALFKIFIVINWLSSIYNRTISARFRHDLSNFTVHSFFRHLYKIVLKIVRALLSVILYITSLYNLSCTKAQSFYQISVRGVAIICSFFKINHQISFAYGTTDCRC